MFPSIEPSDVGLTGLIWLFVSYGYILYYSANLIGEGSELLLLVPSLAGLVGGVVLPLLGAVPDGAIILFSGLGPIEDAQESLSVGVGALAGSTIMLLTIPFALSVYSGRVDIVNGNPNYLRKPKLSSKSLVQEIKQSGVVISEPVKNGGVIMMLTTLPYFLIQVPAMFIHGEAEDIVAGEKWWAFSALLVCVAFWVYYMHVQLKMSKQGEDKEKRVMVMKKMLMNNKISLSGALHGVHLSGEQQPLANEDHHGSGPIQPPPQLDSYLREILMDSFKTYDVDQNGTLDTNEVMTLFRDYNENMTTEEFEAMYKKYDTNGDGMIDFDEFICISYELLQAKERHESGSPQPIPEEGEAGAGGINIMVQNILAETEEDEIPEDFTDLPPDQQQRAIIKRALFMLAAGTILVVLFSDPMVDVMQEIAVRSNIPPFYVSFVLAPLASNSSEVLASMYYASKKTSKTITVSLTALEGAASMNNTFCLSIFMGLVFFRGLAWQYTAETLAILIVQFIVGYFVRREILTMANAVVIAAIFPLSIVLVAVLEYLGFD